MSAVWRGRWWKNDGVGEDGMGGKGSKEKDCKGDREWNCLLVNLLKMVSK